MDVFRWVGMGEIILLLGAVLVLGVSRRLRPWLPGVVTCLIVAALAPGYDPLTTLVLGLPLISAFVAGVYLSPRIRATA